LHHYVDIASLGDASSLTARICFAMGIDFATSETVDADHGWHFVGDSHINMFRHASKRGWITRSCLFTTVAGATTVGMRNPNAPIDSVQIFKKALFPVDETMIPVIQLGEVDCGFVIWFRARRLGESVQHQKKQSIGAYLEFVDAVLAQGYRTVVVTASALPTVRDGVDWKEKANARRDVKATLLERTQLALEYNNDLRHAAAERSIPFIDITGSILDKETRVVSDRFRHVDPTNHHLDPEKVGALWAHALENILL
jgi:hypothetical protein